MKAALSEKLLSELGLPADVLETVIKDLEVMARYKYDHYEMFAPGMRFLEHLYSWLKQFSEEDRRPAVEFIRKHLIFISQREMQDLARFLYYDLIVPELLRVIIEREGLRPFDYGKAFTQHFPHYLRRCLFIGLSDGAKIDFFRRHHIQLSQDQVLPYYRTVGEDYLAQLRKDTGDQRATFFALFLIDDFTASGYTLLREESDADGSGVRQTGTLQRLAEIHAARVKDVERIYLCHYVATHNAHAHVMRLAAKMDAYRGRLKCMAALLLSPEIAILPDTTKHDPLLSRVVAISERYYSPKFEDQNTARAGGIRFGFGNQGLPVVLYSNTPNNSLYVLWLDTTVTPREEQFRALFRRIPRHRPI